MRRRELIAGFAAMAAAPHALRAQQPAMPAIGFLGPTEDWPAPEHRTAFYDGLADAGYVEGRNVVIDYRWCAGHYDRLPDMAQELVRRNVAVIVAWGYPPLLAARQAKTSVPISHLDPLSADPVRLPEIVGSLVLHPLFAPAGSNTAEASLRSIPEILMALLQRDPRPLDRAREPGQRVIGTCRSYALLACAILRQHRVPARLRVGFADYFTPDFWEDHWVCEYHAGDWRLLDAELTAEIRRRFAIPFDPADLPRARFLTAGLAWQRLRRGERDPARFGVSALGLDGLRFAAGSLLRDLAALGMEEMMPWDHWGPARDFRPGVPVEPEWLERFDSLAAALASEPDRHADMPAILAAHPWAALTPSLLSFPQGKAVEVVLDRW